MNPPDSSPPAGPLFEPLRVLIVDDEELARVRLRTLLADCVAPPARVVGELASASAVLSWLTGQRCDLLLLDIHMPGIDGLQLAERLRQLPHAPAVVFVTAHVEHALAAFEVQAVDYLTKPVRRARLQEALARCAQRLARPSRAPAPEPAPVDAGVGAGVVVVQERGAVLRLPVAEVLYLKAEQKAVCVRTRLRSYWIDDASLTELALKLGESFVRVHRNAVVNVRAVSLLERRPLAELSDVDEDGAGSGDPWAVRIEASDEWFTVSRRKLAHVRAVLARNS